MTLYPKPKDNEAVLEYMPDGDQNDSQNMYRMYFPHFEVTGTSRDIRRAISEIEQLLMEMSDTLRESSGT